jgi:DNA-binding NtrC family response regulator
MTRLHTVLVIDDEVHLCNSLAILLKADGYQVDTANSGAQAFNLLQQHAYSVALVDMDLPDISGNHIAARIRDEHPGTAIVILTGNATVDNAVESLRQGVYDYLRKPCPPDRLLRTIASRICTTAKNAFANFPRQPGRVSSSTTGANCCRPTISSAGCLATRKANYWANRYLMSCWIAAPFMP